VHSSDVRVCWLVVLMTACCLAQETPGSKNFPSAPSAVKSALVASEVATENDGQQRSGNEPENHPSENRPSMASKMKDLPFVWLIGPYIPDQSQLVPLTGEERLEAYVRQTYLNAGSYAARAFAAGIDQARGNPYQWGGGAGGYGRRFASRYGQFAIENTLQAAGNAALGYEPRYDFCRCKGFWPRTEHAIARNFYTYNETEQERRPQYALYAGAYAAGMISSTWMPGHQNAWKNGAFVALQQVGYGSAINWVSEFALDILRKAKVARR